MEHIQEKLQTNVESTKKLLKILFKHDKLMSKAYNTSTKEKADKYLEKMTPKIEEYMKTADLNTIAFKGKKYIKFNKFDAESCFVNVQYKSAISPLMWAIRYKKYHFLDEMLKSGTDAKLEHCAKTSTSLSNPTKIGPLQESIRTFDKNLIKYLMDKGAVYNKEMIEDMKKFNFYPEQQTKNIGNCYKGNNEMFEEKEELLAQ